MTDIHVVLRGLRADDVEIVPSNVIPGLISVRLADGVWLQAGGSATDVEADAAAMDRLAERAREAAAMLRGTAGGEAR